MEHQDIMEVSYGDNVASHVITIDLQQQPQQIQSSSGTATILYSPDGHSMTELQSSGITTNPNEYDQQHTTTVDKISPSYNTSTVLAPTNDIVQLHNNDQTITGHSESENQVILIQTDEIKPERVPDDVNKNNNGTASNGTNSNSSASSTRFKWTKEKSQVAMNLVKHGCKPKLVSVAVGCSLRTAQKFVETVTPKMEGESFKNYVIKRRGRKSKDVNERLDAIREVMSKDSTKTQVEIAAGLKVSNTTVCRDMKRIKGNTWKEKEDPTSSSPSSPHPPPYHQSVIQSPTDISATTTTSKRENKKDRQSTNNDAVRKQSPSSSATNNKNKTRGKQKANNGDV